jgi:hypothetical protein
VPSALAAAVALEEVIVLSQGRKVLRKEKERERRDRGAKKKKKRISVDVKRD